MQIDVIYFNHWCIDRGEKKRDGIASGLKPKSDRSTQNKQGKNGTINVKEDLQKRKVPTKRIVELQNKIDELLKRNSMPPRKRKAGISLIHF